MNDPQRFLECIRQPAVMVDGTMYRRAGQPARKRGREFEGACRLGDV